MGGAAQRTPASAGRPRVPTTTTSVRSPVAIGDRMRSRTGPQPIRDARQVPTAPTSPGAARRHAARPGLNCPASARHVPPLGAIAQLGERLDRTQEVGGSSPPSSIKKSPPNRRVFCWPHFKVRRILMLGIRIGHQIGIRTETVRSSCAPRRSRNRPWSCASFATLTTPGTDCRSAPGTAPAYHTQNGSGRRRRTDRRCARAVGWAPRDANAIVPSTSSA